MNRFPCIENGAENGAENGPENDLSLFFVLFSYTVLFIPWAFTAENYCRLLIGYFFFVGIIKPQFCFVHMRDRIHEHIVVQYTEALY